MFFMEGPIVFPATTSEVLRNRSDAQGHAAPYNSGVSPLDQVQNLVTSEDAYLALCQEIEAIADKLCETRSLCVYLAEGLGGVDLKPEHLAVARVLQDNLSSMQMQLRS